MEARIVFTNNFKEKTMRRISNKRKGQLRVEKLKVAEANGSLAKCRKRIDVAKLVGINDGKVGYTWVQRMIHEKILYEVEVGRDKHNYAIYQYCLNNKSIVSPEPKKTEKIKFTPKPDYAQFKVSKTSSVVITYGKVVAEVKGDVDFITDVIKKLGDL